MLSRVSYCTPLFALGLYQFISLRSSYSARLQQEAVKFHHTCSSFGITGLNLIS